MGMHSNLKTENIELNKLIDCDNKKDLLKYILTNKTTINFNALELRRKFIILSSFEEFLNLSDYENETEIYEILKLFIDQNPEMEKLTEYKIVLKKLRQVLTTKCDLNKLYR